MKKIIGLLSVIITLTTISCTNEPVKEKKDVVVVPVPSTKKEVIVVPSAPATQKGTSVTVDKTGVKVETKK